MIETTFFRRDTRGAAAVEFALIASMLIFLILFLMTAGFILYLNQALDYAASKAARQVMIGAVQKGNLSQSSFITTDLCPYLPAALSCANVIVNLQTATEAAQPAGYYTYLNNPSSSNPSGLIIPTLSNASTQFLPGSQGSYEYLQVIYPITYFPSVFASMFSNGATYNGAPAYLAVSTAVFKNEQY